MSEVIAVSSGKGGTGKSTVCAGIGNALAHSGYSVIIVELDFGFRCLDVFFGITDRVKFDILDYFHGSCRLNECINKVADLPGLSIICAPFDFSGRSYYKKIKGMIRSLKRMYDFVILDLGAGADRSIIRALGGVDRTFFVVTPDTVSIRDAANLSEVFYRHGLYEQRLIINKVHKKYIDYKMIKNLDAVIDKCGIQLIGAVPEDMELVRFYGNGKRLSEHSPGYIAFMAIAERICGENVSLRLKLKRNKK